MAYTIGYHCVSHIGKIRRQNQDNFVCLDRMQHYNDTGTDGVIFGETDTDYGAAFAVFDGMGGEECGEMAAYIAAGTMLELKPGKGGSREMTEFCLEANRRICRYAEENEIFSMGTTAAILCFAGERILLCNIGDSKVFQLSGENFRQISKDHVTPSICGHKPPLSQNLGIPESEFLIEPHLARGTCRDGDQYLICSDGLTDMVSEERIEELLRSEDAAAADALLREALDNGGRDNITILHLRVIHRKDPFFKKLFGGRRND